MIAGSVCGRCSWHCGFPGSGPGLHPRSGCNSAKMCPQNAWTLCFEDRSVEAHFHKSIEKEFTIATAILSTAVCILTVATAWSVHLQAVTDEADSIVFTFSMFAIMAMLSGVFAVCSSLHAVYGALSRIHWEPVFVFMSTLFAIAYVLSSRWHGPLLFNECPDDVWSSDSRQSATRMPLGLAIGLAIFCSYIPLSFHVVWVLPVFSIGLHAGLLCSFPAPVDGCGMDVFGLVVLTVFSLHGSYKQDKCRRRLWLAARNQSVAETYAEHPQDVHEDQIEWESEHLDTVLPLPGSTDTRDKRHSRRSHSGHRIGRRVLGKARCSTSSAWSSEMSSTSTSCSEAASSHSSESSTLSMRDQEAGTSDSVHHRCEQADGHPPDESAVVGQWEIMGGPIGIASWLRRLDIRQDCVLDGDGTMTYLRYSAGNIFLEGGKLTIEGDFMVREGKRSRAVFKRVQGRQASH